MPAYEGLEDWRQHAVPFLVALVGIVIILMGSDALGFMLLIAALLYSGLRGDAGMEKTEAF